MPEASYHCAHQGCQCMLSKGDGEFCGDYCREAAKQPATDAPCKCGHPECQSKAHAAPELQSDG